MGRVKIAYVKDPRSGGSPDTEYEFDVEHLSVVGPNRAILDTIAGHRLIELFGNGYMQRGFHLVVGNEMLVDCRIIGTGATFTLSFMSVAPAPTS